VRKRRRKEITNRRGGGGGGGAHTDLGDVMLYQKKSCTKAVEWAGALL